MDRQLGIFDPCNAAAVKQGNEDGGCTIVDRQLGLIDPCNAVKQGCKDWGRNGSKAAKAKVGAKGGAAGKGVTKPRMTAAQKALLPHGSGGCGKLGVVGAQHNKPKADTGGKVEKCGMYQASE